MRKVLSSSSEVMHKWANKVQSEGRTSSGNVFFDGPDYIWSYGMHFCMARHMPDGHVAISNQRTTPTTSGHLSEVRYATNHLKQIFVPSPNHKAAHQKREVEVSITILLDKASRAREQKPWLMERASKEAEDFNTFAALLKERVRIKVTGIDEWKAAVAKRDSKEARESAKVRALQDRADKLRLEEQRVAEIEGRAAWRQGDRGYFTDPVMLRCSDKEARIETSAGAVIPVAAALRLWPMIERVKASGIEFNGINMRLGDYTLNSIRTNGSIRVGCHDIAFDEIEAIHTQLVLLGFQFKEEEEEAA